VPQKGKCKLSPPTSKNGYNRAPLIAGKCKNWPSKTKNSWPSSVQGEKFPVLVRARTAKKFLATREERTRIRIKIKIKIRMTKEVPPIRTGCPIRVRWQIPPDSQLTPGPPNSRKS
jgi:hypothetical protein